MLLPASCLVLLQASWVQLPQASLVEPLWTSEKTVCTANQLVVALSTMPQSAL